MDFCGRPPRVKTSRGDSEPFSSPPGGRIKRSVAAGHRAQSSRRSPAAPNADLGCSGTSGFSRRLSGASVFKWLQLDVRLTMARAKSVIAQRGDEPLGVEHGFLFEHEIDGAGQLDGEHGIRLELVVEPRFEPLGQGADDERIAFGHHGGFAEGPAQIGVAEFGSPQAFDFAGAGDGAFDEAAIGEEIFDGGKAGDVADLVEDGQPEIIADAGRGLQQREVAAAGLFGESEEFLFEGGQLGVVMGDQGQVILQGELAHRVRLGCEHLFTPCLPVVRGLAAGGPVVSELMGLEAGQEFAAVPDVKNPLAEQGAERTFFCGIDIARRNEVGAQQMGDLLGINAVVLVLAAVNGFEVERVGEHEVDASLGTGVGQPIPAEHAFGADRQIVAIGRDEFEEIGEVIVFDVGVDELFAVAVQDADVHLACVQINSAVEFSGGGVILHGDHSLWGRETPGYTFGYAGKCS